jgi:hypothetical protein
MSRPIDERKHTYIGDGVYAEGKGTMITISCDRAENGVNRIALEPDVLEGLLKYAKKLGWLKTWEWQTREEEGQS